MCTDMVDDEDGDDDNADYGGYDDFFNDVKAAIRFGPNINTQGAYLSFSSLRNELQLLLNYCYKLFLVQECQPLAHDCHPRRHGAAIAKQDDPVVLCIIDEMEE